MCLELFCFRPSIEPEHASHNEKLTGAKWKPQKSTGQGNTSGVDEVERDPSYGHEKQRTQQVSASAANGFHDGPPKFKNEGVDPYAKLSAVKSVPDSPPKFKNGGVDPYAQPSPQYPIRSDDRVGSVSTIDAQTHRKETKVSTKTPDNSEDFVPKSKIASTDAPSLWDIPSNDQTKNQVRYPF